MLSRLVLLACALAQQLSAQVPYDSTFSHYARLLNFTLEKSPIGEVQRELGKVQTNDGGDGGDRSERATYYFPLEKSYVTFDVTEMGSDSTILQFLLRSESNSEAFVTVHNKSFARSDLGGLRLGMRKEDFISQFKDHAETKGDTVYVQFWFIAGSEGCLKRVEEFPDEIPKCDITLSLFARFADQRLCDLSIFKVTTY